MWKPFGQRKHAGACSGQQPSCATSRLLRFWISTHIEVQRTCGQVLGRVAFVRPGGHKVSVRASECRHQSQFHESNPEISAFVPSRPWNSVIRATSNDRDFWKEELEDKVADFRNVRQVVNKFGSKDRSRSRRRGGTKQDRGRTGGAHPHRGSDGRYSTPAIGSQICFAWNRAQDGCTVKVRHQSSPCMRVLCGTTQSN